MRLSWKSTDILSSKKRRFTCHISSTFWHITHFIMSGKYIVVVWLFFIWHIEERDLRTDTSTEKKWAHHKETIIFWRNMLHRKKKLARKARLNTRCSTLSLTRFLCWVLFNFKKIIIYFFTELMPRAAQPSRWWDARTRRGSSSTFPDRIMRLIWPRCNATQTHCSVMRAAWSNSTTSIGTSTFLIAMPIVSSVYSAFTSRMGAH